MVECVEVLVWCGGDSGGVVCGLKHIKVLPVLLLRAHMDPHFE